MTVITHHCLWTGDRVVNYELTRKAIKNINLRIHSDGTLHVSAPPFVSQNQIEEFLQHEQDFILQTLAEMEKKPVPKLRTGEKLYVNGMLCRLLLKRGTAEEMYLDGNTLYMETMHGNDKEARAGLYHDFLRRIAGPLFKQSLDRIYPLVAPYGVPLPTVQLRRMRSRWGSCTPFRRKVSLNIYLAVMDDDCIDQIVLHELCHFLQCNHSSHFYEWMDLLMPDWRERKEAMQKYLSYCEI